MNRRKALKRLAVLTGGALSFSTVAGVLGGCTATDEPFSLRTLSPAQNKMVIHLSERIIPATDTPGAKAAGVNRFIDHMLTNWSTEMERTHFLDGLSNLNERCNRRHHNDFVELDKDKKIEIMRKLEQEALDNPNPKLNTGLKPFFDMLKEFTVVGYYTSEIGATQELNSDIYPGYYDACMPYSQAGRAWS